MYVLSANSQNMQGEGIDSLCLEEAFRNAPSGVCHLEASFAFWGKVKARCPRVWMKGPQESSQGPHSMMGGSGDPPVPKEPKIKSESSVVLDTREEIQVKPYILIVYYGSSYAGAFQVFLPFK